jgi:molybdate transport system ATP-binding protein
MGMEIVRTGIASSMAEAIATSAGVLDAEVHKSAIADGSQFELNVSFSLPAGITILFGSSGAGKTTLLDTLAGIVQPDSGHIRISGCTIYDSAHKIFTPPQQRKVGYVFQDLALFPHLSVQENVEYGLHAFAKSQRNRRAEEILRAFGIGHLSRQKAGRISGGERQRTALARALVVEPDLLLLDEPMAALDAASRTRIISSLRSWNEAHRIPILYVTHSREEVFALGERVLVLESGRIIAKGTPHEVMTAPREETVAQLAGFENIFDAEVRAVHEERGTMVCAIAESNLELETPLVRADIGSHLRLGISAGDILLAAARPEGLSARNILPGTITSLVQQDVVVTAMVNCGVEFAVHLTLAARDSLHLQPGSEAWLIVKTHSCHLMMK